MRRRIVTCTLLILIVGAGALWWQRTPLLAWWHVRQLMQADEASRDVYVERVVALEEAALPCLFKGLASADDRACANIEAAIAELARSWKTLDPRSRPFLL